MPRRREHNPEHVLNGLVSAFSELGYEAASFSDLEKATGLDRAQLSREYGDKRTLFLTAMERMTDAAFSAYLQPLAQHGGIREIRRMLLSICDLAGTEQGRIGCLVCNTCREPVALTDPDVISLVDKHFRRLEGAFASALRNSVAAGELTMMPADIRRVSRHLYGVHVSLMVMLRAGETRAVLRDVVLQAIRSIDAE